MFLAKPYKISSKTGQRTDTFYASISAKSYECHIRLLLQSGSKITSMLKKSWSERKPDFVSGVSV